MGTEISGSAQPEAFAGLRSSSSGTFLLAASRSSHQIITASKMDCGARNLLPAIRPQEEGPDRVTEDCGFPPAAVWLLWIRALWHGVHWHRTFRSWRSTSTVGLLILAVSRS